jgi:hypothetical protein
MNRREFLKLCIVVGAALVLPDIDIPKVITPVIPDSDYGTIIAIVRDGKLVLRSRDYGATWTEVTGDDWRDLDSDTQVMGIIDTEWSEFMERAAMVSMTGLEGCYLERGR